MDFNSLLQMIGLGKKENPNPLSQNPNVVSPLPAHKEVDPGFEHYKKMQMENMNAPLGKSFQPQQLQYPESLSNAGPKNFDELQGSMGQKAPMPTPTPDPRQSWENMVDMIMRESEARGYDGDTIASQKALESARGTSKFAQDRYNYGGVGAYDANPENAFRYDSPEDYLMGPNGYFNLIENDPRYEQAYTNRGNPQRYLEELKKAGYASDPNYVSKVQNTRAIVR